MKSTLLNMTAVLFGITLVASAGVGAVNMITAEPIAQAEQAAKTAALNGVLPAFDETAAETLTIDEMPITVYTATKGGQLAGYAVESMTKNGFGGARLCGCDQPCMDGLQERCDGCNPDRRVVRRDFRGRRYGGGTNQRA